MKTITLPASLTKIGEGAFSACYALQSVTIPEGVTEIGPYAFQECYYLTSVLLPASLIKIEDGAFHKCYSLTSVTIPAAVTEIGNYALQDCNGLTWIDVEKGNQNYASENGVLFNIDKTTLIKCPAGITGEYAIPASVTEIESCAFAACQNLAWIAIPRSVTKIGDSAFEYCSNLKTIYNLNPTPQTLGEKAFDGVPEDAVVYIPQGSYKSYYLSWGYFSDFREMGALDIALSKQTLDLKTGDTATITITVTKDDDVTIESEEWSSSNPEVATVDNGIIAAVAPGEAVIWYTAVDGNAVPHTESCKVTVIENSGVTEVVNDADTSIEVFNLQGVAVLRNASTTELRNLPAGIYIVRKGTSVKKIVVK